MAQERPYYRNTMRALSLQEKHAKYEYLCDTERKRDPLFGILKFELQYPWEVFEKELHQVGERHSISPEEVKCDWQPLPHILTDSKN